VTSAQSKPLDDALARMIAAAPAGISVTSEVRDAKQQQVLWDAAVKKYGSVAEARKWVAPPGHSQHQLGTAADLAFTTPAARQWAHDNAARFGLVFPLGNEPWHVEIAGARKAGGAAAAAIPGLTDQINADSSVSIKNYGYIAALAQSNSDLKKLMQKYANQDLSSPGVQARLQGEIQDTKWWKTTTAQQRATQVLERQDPAEFKRQFDNAFGTVQDLASQLGVTMPGLGLHDFAVKAYKNGWTPQEQKRFLLAEATRTTAQQATGLSTLKTSAAQYMVPLSDPTLDQWAKNISAGSVTQQDFTTYLIEQAKIMRPWASKQLDAGLTTSQVVDPYRNLIASTLEVDPNRVDFTLPKFSAILDGNSDKTTGQHGPMSLSQAGAYLRGLDDYKSTASAIDQGAQFATQLTKTFGALAT